MSCFFIHSSSRDNEQRKNLRLSHFAIAVFFLFLILMNVYQSAQIGALFEARNYIAKYYVMTSRFDGKYYKLPAQINRAYNVSENRYSIYRVYFSNGGFLQFGSDFTVKPNEETVLLDQNSEEWLVILTTEPVPNNLATSTDPHNTIDTIQLICYISGFLYALFILKKSSCFSYSYFQQILNTPSVSDKKETPLQKCIPDSDQAKAVMQRYAKVYKSDLEDLISQMNEKADAINIEPAPPNYSTASAAIYRYSKVCNTSVINMLKTMQDKSDEAGVPPLPFDVTIIN